MSKRTFVIDAEKWTQSEEITVLGAEGEGAYFRLLCCAVISSDSSVPDDAYKLSVLSRLFNRWGIHSENIRLLFTEANGRLVSNFLTTGHHSSRNNNE